MLILIFASKKFDAVLKVQFKMYTINLFLITSKMLMKNYVFYFCYMMYNIHKFIWFYIFLFVLKLNNIYF